MQIDEAVFREPSLVPGFFDETFPDGSDPEEHGLTRAVSISFDLTKDQPNNLIKLESGNTYILAQLSAKQVARALLGGSPISNATIWGLN